LVVILKGCISFSFPNNDNEPKNRRASVLRSVLLNDLKLHDCIIQPNFKVYQRIMTGISNFLKIFFPPLMLFGKNKSPATWPKCCWGWGGRRTQGTCRPAEAAEEREKLGKHHPQVS
jgi:hypothetical protein